MNVVVKLKASLNATDVLIRCLTVSFSGRMLLHGVSNAKRVCYSEMCFSLAVSSSRRNAVSVFIVDVSHRESIGNPSSTVIARSTVCFNIKIFLHFLTVFYCSQNKQ